MKQIPIEQKNAMIIEAMCKHPHQRILPARGAAGDIWASFGLGEIEGESAAMLYYNIEPGGTTMTIIRKLKPSRPEFTLRRMSP